MTDEQAVRAAVGEVVQAIGGPKPRLAGLVNNAGVAASGPLLHLPLDELRQQLEINVVAQLGVTQAFAPLLGASADARDRPAAL